MNVSTPSAVQLRAAAGQLEQHGNSPVAVWLREVATRQDELELRQSIAERTGRDVDDEWVVAAARKVAAEMTNEPNGSD